MKKKWIGLVVILMFIAGVVGAWFLYWKHEQIYPSTEDAYVAGDIYRISSRVPGTILTLPVEENQPVAAGDVIGTLDPRDYDQAVDRARAALAQARTAPAAERARIAEARADVRAAESDLELKRLDLERFKNLVERRSIPKRSYDQAVAAEKVAAARLAAAKKALAAAQAELRLSEKRVHTAKVGLERAELERSYCTIRTPVAGIVSQKTTQVGQVVAPGQPLCAVVPLGKGHIWVEANFKETQLARIRPGQTVHFHTDVNRKREYTGVVESLSAGTGAAFSLLPPENATGNWVKIVQRLPVRIAVDPSSNADHSLRLGLSVHVRVDSTTEAGEATDGDRRSSRTGTDEPGDDE